MPCYVWLGMTVEISYTLCLLCLLGLCAACRYLELQLRPKI